MQQALNSSMEKDIQDRQSGQGFHLHPLSLLYRCYQRVEHTLVPILLVLLVPLAAGLLLGAEFSGNSVDRVPTAIVDQDHSQLSRDLTEKIRTNSTFRVTAYTESTAELQNLIEHGEVAAGIIIPPGFSADMLNGKAPKVMILYDGAQMSMTGAAKGKIAETLSTIKSGYIMQVMMGRFSLSQEQAMQYVQPVSYTTRVLGNPQKSNPVFMLQGLLLNFIQVSVFILGVELVRKNQRSYKNLWRHGAFAGLMGSISVLLCICSQTLIFDVPFRGSGWTAALMTIIYMSMIGNLGVAAMVKKEDRLEAVQSSSMITAMLMLCGYTFPLLAMPPFLQKLALFLPFTYYGSPMRDISLLGSGFRLELPNLLAICGFYVLSCGYLAYSLHRAHKPKKAKKHPTAKLEERITEQDTSSITWTTTP